MSSVCPPVCASQSQKHSTVTRHDVAVTVVKRRHIGLCKIRKSADAKKYKSMSYIHANNMILNFKRPGAEFSIRDASDY